jgi:hypothetical protein
MHKTTGIFHKVRESDQEKLLKVRQETRRKREDVREVRGGRSIQVLQKKQELLASWAHFLELRFTLICLVNHL